MLEALDNLEEIVRLSDGVMVARGDLAVEIGQTRLPQVQKQIVKICNSIGRPVITATQMLDSMTENPRPTRAEITDVANAVLDGSDALMLSAESASGKFPFRCIQTMHDIILEVERNGDYFYNMRMDEQFSSVADGIGAASALTALKLNATAIVCLTTSGKTATIIAGYRPKARIIAVTHILPTLNRIELVWGIQTLKIDPYKSSDEAMQQIEKMLLEYGLVKPGDKVILTLVYRSSSGELLIRFAFILSVEKIYGVSRRLNCLLAVARFSRLFTLSCLNLRKLNSWLKVAWDESSQVLYRFVEICKRLQRFIQCL
jgi:pyruvate kinase